MAVAKSDIDRKRSKPLIGTSRSQPLVAKRGDEALFAEVKGNTKGRPGFGVDSMYGQLLRRMAAAEAGERGRDYAVVVPTRSVTAALRVPRRVRDLLRISIYAVLDDGQVESVVEEDSRP